VFGSNNAYADESSICRAAIHAGVIQDQIGGNFIISMNEDCKSYVGNLSNDVLSLGLPNGASKGGKTFHAYKLKNNCPKVNKGVSSFI